MDLRNKIDQILAAEDISGLLASSFKDFHAKGLNYLCLHRSAEHTIKLYILDGDASKLPEVVNPHDHRYAFKTSVICGGLMDYRFDRVEAGGEVFSAFDYMTPLNGGNGFTFRGEERLKRTERIFIQPGETLATDAAHLHTIRTTKDYTVLLLEQFADMVAIDHPTSCWVRNGEPAPNTSGLYGQFSDGQFRDLLRTIREKL